MEETERGFCSGQVSSDRYVLYVCRDLYGEIPRAKERKKQGSCEGALFLGWELGTMRNLLRVCEVRYYMLQYCTAKRRVCIYEVVLHGDGDLGRLMLVIEFFLLSFGPIADLFRAFCGR